MKLVIFDVDGTLVDSQRMIVTAMSRAFMAHGLAVPTRDEILSVVGLSLGQAVSTLVSHRPGLPVAEVAQAYKEAFSALRASDERDEPLYPGALECLTALVARPDITLGIATGKSRRGVDNLIEHYGFQGWFATIQTADEHPSKPHPSMILTALAETGLDAPVAVMVGDTVYDMAMARSAGVHAIGVSWGYHDVAQLASAGADPIIHHYDQLIPAIDRLR